MPILKCVEAEIVQIGDDIELVAIKTDHRAGDVTVGIIAPLGVGGHFGDCAVFSIANTRKSVQL